MKYLEKHPMIMIAVGVVGISMSSIFVKYSAAPSTVTAAFRLLWTVLIMTPLTLGKRQTRTELRQLDKRSLLLSALSGLFLAIHFWLWFESLNLTSVASSTAIVCTEVIWVAIGYRLFMKGRISKKAAAVILVALLGSVLVAFSDSGAGDKPLQGDILALIAAVAVAAYTLIGRAVRKTASATVYTYVVYLVCAAALVIISVVQGHRMFSFGWSAVITGLLLALFSTILGHSIFSWCLKYFSPAFVSASKLCEPVVAAVLAGFLFGELPTWLQAAGGILIIGGVLLYSLIEKAES